MKKKRAGKQLEFVVTQPNFEVLHVQIRGTEPLVMNALPLGKRCKLAMERSRDPLTEINEAIYHIPGEREDAYGLPAHGFKRAMLTVAKDLPDVPRFEKSIMRGVFVEEDAAGLVRIQSISGWRMLDRGCGLLVRHLPEFSDWSAQLRIRYDANLFDAQVIVNLLARAGLAIGVGWMRAEKGYNGGSWEIAGDVKVVREKAA